MSQIRITKQRRTVSARRRGQVEELLPLDPRDPGITRAKQLQRQTRRPSGPRLSRDDRRAARAETSP
jgi:hypothetical protein